MHLPNNSQQRILPKPSRASSFRFLRFAILLQPEVDAQTEQEQFKDSIEAPRNQFDKWDADVDTSTVSSALVQERDIFDCDNSVGEETDGEEEKKGCFCEELEGDHVEWWGGCCWLSEDDVGNLVLEMERAMEYVLTDFTHSLFHLHDPTSQILSPFGYF